MQKRLFFGLELIADWPQSLPKGRVIDEQEHHLTLAFLGQVSFPELEELLPTFPKPKSKIGFSGKCDHLIFLPKKTPRIVAGAIHWFENASFMCYQQSIELWLKKHKYPVDHREFLSHITLARMPFEQEEWKNYQLTPFPLITKAIHLYESIGNLHYSSLWSFPLLLPFEEFEHTADIAFLIRGETFQDLFLHAAIALIFNFPPLLNYFAKPWELSDLNSIIRQLNYLIALADSEIGVPFKAVSFHGEVKAQEDYLEWEMIVDV